MKHSKNMSRTTPQEALRLVKTSSELEMLGFSPATIRRHYSAGKLHRIRRGAYVDARHWQKMNGYERSLTLHAAVLKQSPKAVLSRQSAALWYGAPLLMNLTRVHLSTTYNGFTKEDVIYHREPKDTSEAPVTHEGARLVPALQTSLDVAANVPPLEALCIIDYFAHNNFCSLTELQTELMNMQGRGSRRARELARIVSNRV